MSVSFKRTSASKKYQEAFQNILADICDKKNDQPKKITDINGGQTDTLKKVVEFKTETFFVKIGEKVDKENAIYQKKLFNNQMFLKPNENFSSGNILVLPYLDGINLEDLLFKERLILTPERIIFLKNLLNKTFRLFWSQNLSKTALDLKIITNYIEERTIPLYKEDAKIVKLFSAPVVYQRDGVGIELPPIKKMVEKVLMTFANMNSVFSSCIVGDFQPSNIIVSGQDFKIVDLSNGSENGDIALDVGKFFNFINRFHFVAQLRNNTDDKDVNVKISFDKHLIVQSFDYPGFLQIKLAENLEEGFSEFIANKIGDYTFSDRLKLYKFIVNLITIRRHLQLGVPLDSLLSAMVDSYFELETKVFNI